MISLTTLVFFFDHGILTTPLRVNLAEFTREPGVNFSSWQKKVFRMSVSKTGKPPSFSAILTSFHSVGSVRK